MNSPHQPPAGWYPNPTGQPGQMYWDGRGWDNAVTPPPVAPEQPPHPAKGSSGLRNGGFVLAGLALLLGVAALVAGRIFLGTFLPGIVLVAAIAILGVTFTLRSRRSGARKAIVVAAMLLVVAVAIPASLKVVYPAYDHFFPRPSTQVATPSVASLPPESHSSPGSNPSASPSPASQSSAAAAPSWNIVINGQTQTFPQGADSRIEDGFDNTSVSCGHHPIHIVAGGGQGIVANLIEGTLQVQQVTLTDTSGNTYLYDPQQTAYHVGGGDAQATGSGNTFKITGDIAPYMNAQHQIQKDATPVPFEFDATCQPAN